MIFNVQFHIPIQSLSFTNDLYVVGKVESVVLMSLDHKPVKEIPTGHNMKGIHAVSYGDEFCVATPHK